jgi:hypothetical protein
VSASSSSAARRAPVGPAGPDWGTPPPETVHQWQLLAAQAARQLDPQVTLPDRVAGVQHAAQLHSTPGALYKTLHDARDAASKA